MFIKRKCTQRLSEYHLHESPTPQKYTVSDERVMVLLTTQHYGAQCIYSVCVLIPLTARQIMFLGLDTPQQHKERARTAYSLYVRQCKQLALSGH